MKTVAVICEYDPFHRGHRCQIETIRAVFGEDSTVISLMSGSTVQRGRLATYPKHIRAAAALACGSDLVLELPALYSNSSAEHFATGAVRLLDLLGGVDVLVFGSECGDLTSLSGVAKAALSEPFRRALASADAALSHPRAVEAALRACGVTPPTTPNDILGVEYLAALMRIRSVICPYTYRREEGFSATEARRLLYGHHDPSPMIPEEAMALFTQVPPTDPYAYEAIALHTLRETPIEVLEGYYGMNGGVAGLLQRQAADTASPEALIVSATCRTYTASRLRRAILSAVLKLTDADRQEEPRFTNLLGANERGRRFLRTRKKASDIAIVTKPADGLALPSPAREQFEKNCQADRLMALCRGEAASSVLRTMPVVL